MTGAIHFILTGGTIDSRYDPIKETAVPNERSAIPGFIPLLHLYEDCEYTQLFMKDSRDVSQEDRQHILDAVNGSSCSRVIITHGSFTVADSAQFLQSNLQDTEKVVIFVCSMIPLYGIAPTDAGFNLGYAVAKSQDLDPGVYVCVNGRVFQPEEIVKILEEGRFGSKYTK